MCLLLECWKSQSFLKEKATFKVCWMETFCSMEVELTWMGLWNGAVEGQLLFKEKRHQRSLAIRREDTWHVSKLCVKTLFISKNFYFFFRSFLCIGRNCNILHLQDVVLGHFGKRDFTPAINSLSTSREVDNAISICQTSRLPFTRALIGQKKVDYFLAFMHDGTRAFF